jgi:hypothetical protein
MRAFVLTLALALLPGCSSTWLNNFANDPSAQVATVEGIVSNVVQISGIVFASIKANLPVAQQAQAQADYNKAVVAVNNTMALAETAVQIAVDSKSSTVNVSQLITDVMTAVSQLQTFIDGLKSQQAVVAGALAVAAPPTGYVEFTNHVINLKKLFIRITVAGPKS